MKKYFKKILILIIGLIICIMPYTCSYYATISTFRQLSGKTSKYGFNYIDKLPLSTAEINEGYVEAFPDYTYYLRAKISTEEFYDFVEEFELDSISIGCDQYVNTHVSVQKWWNPRTALFSYGKCYFHDDNKSTLSSKTLVDFQNGYIYVFAIKY